jgi:hypothetical protein
MQALGSVEDADGEVDGRVKKVSKTSHRAAETNLGRKV